MKFSESIKLLSDMSEQLEMIIGVKFDELRAATEFLEAKFALDGEFDLKHCDLIVEYMDEIEMFQDMRRSCETVIRCYECKEEASDG